jgi:hypothetical protein
MTRSGGVLRARVRAPHLVTGTEYWFGCRPSSNTALQPSAPSGRPRCAEISRHFQTRSALTRRAVSIILQSTVGGFSAEFMRKLPRLEQAMIAHGLEPSQFVISKEGANQPSCRWSGRSSTTTRVRRRREFHRHRAGRHQVPRIFLPALHRTGRGHAGAARQTESRSRLFSWMTQPI